MRPTVTAGASCSPGRKVQRVPALLWDRPGSVFRLEDRRGVPVPSLLS